MDDWDVGSDRWPRRQLSDAALGINAHPVPQQLYQRVELLGPHEYVHLGEPAFQGVGLRPDHAAHESDHLVGACLLQGLQRSQGAGDAVFGALTHYAAIQDDHVGIGHRLRRAEAHLAQGALQTLGVRLVHLAAYSPDMVGLHLSGSWQEWRGGGNGIRTHERAFAP